MKIAMLGSLGNVNRVAVPELLNAGHEVTLLTSLAERVAEIEALGAHAVVGSMTNLDDLIAALTGADVAYLMLTGRATGSLVAHGEMVGKLFKQAIEATGVKRVVNLSSVGADQGPEIGALYVYNILEGLLASLPIDITFVRPVAFYGNLMGSIQTIKAQHAIINNFPASHRNAYVWPADIAKTVVDAILHPVAGQTVRYVVSDLFTGDELVAALQEALDMPDLKWIEISDEQALANMTAKGMPEAVATEFVKLGASQRNESAYTDLTAHMPVLGDFKLADFLPIFKAAYNK
ncbi:SDR family oxidoreductase [Weissella confusa]|uniref:Short-chain dehydrogenase n=2 Tax=Weissella confusa TaxID=1583 RepID=A0A4Z0S0B2_WEICO|nr:NAD(P)H-binding protein [Weissella confusa]TGE75637.1 short-chain dehydrogenase [Weissella confusa]